MGLVTGGGRAEAPRWRRDAVIEPRSARIQVLPDGQPIVLMADRQTAGGYPVIATVVQDDIAPFRPCVPGEATVKFQAVPATRTPDRR